MVEARLAKKHKANTGKATVAPITELATGSTPAKRASATAPTTMFIDDVRAILRQARRGAYTAANHIMVQAYWNIGRRIVREEQGGKHRADYGQFLIRNLARQLGDEFGGGVSVANLWNFRLFYLTFPAESKLYAVRRVLTWTGHKNCPVKKGCHKIGSQATHNHSQLPRRRKGGTTSEFSTRASPACEVCVV